VCGGICSTIATAASSQSVMTFAKADGAKLLKATTNNPLQRLDNMMQAPWVAGN
jgi:hypothetical protein